jgi:hypothetical protein
MLKSMRRISYSGGGNHRRGVGQADIEIRSIGRFTESGVEVAVRLGAKLRESDFPGFRNAAGRDASSLFNKCDTSASKM